jgi:hypothetical protein
MSWTMGEGAKFILRWLFAVVVFALGFYGIVLYDFALDDLTKGALISLMTLAAQSVFGEAIASGATRRQQQAYDAGVDTTPPAEATPGAG